MHRTYQSTFRVCYNFACILDKFDVVESSSISILCTASLNRRYFKFIVVVTVPRNQPACMQPRCLDECVLGKFCILKKRIIFSILVVNADLLKLVCIVARWSFISLVVCRFGLKEMRTKTCLRNLFGNSYTLQWNKTLL